MTRSSRKPCRTWCSKGRLIHLNDANIPVPHKCRISSMVLALRNRTTQERNSAESKSRRALGNLPAGSRLRHPLAESFLGALPCDLEGGSGSDSVRDCDGSSMERGLPPWP